METEYIEKQDIYDAIDLLMTRFPYKVPGRPDTYDPYNEAWASACSYALDLIRYHQPTDVRPVVRGRWVRKNTDGSWRVDVCSCCKKEMHYINYAPGYNYCPNCGADMRGCDAE